MHADAAQHPIRMGSTWNVSHGACRSGVGGWRWGGRVDVAGAGRWVVMVGGDGGLRVEGGRWRWVVGGGGA